MLYARTTRSYGTNSDIVIFSNTPASGWQPVSSATHFIIKQLVARSKQGVAVAGLRTRDLAALHDIETVLSIRLDRKHRAGRVCLRSNVDVIDQRTSVAEVA